MLIFNKYFTKWQKCQPSGVWKKQEDGAGLRGQIIQGLQTFQNTGWTSNKKGVSEQVRVTVILTPWTVMAVSLSIPIYQHFKGATGMTSPDT